MLPVTHALTKHLVDSGFQLFEPNTHLVAMPHFLPDTLDLMDGLLALGLSPKNIHLIGKQDSLVYEVQEELKKRGIDVMTYSEPKPGQYEDTLENIIPQFWQHVALQLGTKETQQKMIILDNGGILRHKLPHTLSSNHQLQKIAVEPIKEGVSTNIASKDIPVILPAASGLKHTFEPLLIANGAVNKVETQLQADSTGMEPCAVIGCGLIGNALVKALAKREGNVFVFDQQDNFEGLLPKENTIYKIPEHGTPENAILINNSIPPGGKNIYTCASLQDAVHNADRIFGCTGHDLFADKDIERFDFGDSPKRFMSISLGDIEFSSLLKWMVQKKGFSLYPSQGRNKKDCILQTPKGEMITVARQGFPVNFDGHEGSGTIEEMQLITGFLLGSIAQASMLLNAKHTESGHIMFSPSLQRFIMEEWLAEVNTVQNLYNPSLIEEIRTEPQWFNNNSGGTERTVIKDKHPTSPRIK